MNIIKSSIKSCLSMGVVGLLFSLNVLANPTTLATEEVKLGNRNIIHEVFYYACSHCQQIESSVLKWSNTIDSTKTEFQKMPINLSPKQELGAKHYYASEYLEVTESFNKLYFSKIKTSEDLSDEKAIETFISIGVKKEKAIEALNSNWVKTKVDKARELSLKYKVDTVPLFVINEKYIFKRSNYNKDENLYNAIEEKLKE